MAKDAKKIRQPVTQGVARVPVVMQMEALECGAAVTVISRYPGTPHTQAPASSRAMAISTIQTPGFATRI